MGRPATILFLGANPSSTTRLALNREVREIDKRLRASEHRDAFRLEQAWAVRASDLNEVLLRYRPTIVHFSGHGSDAGELLLEDENGFEKPIDVKALADLFRIVGVQVRCVVLNACYSETQAKPIVEHVDCAIGTSKSIDDDASIAFVGTFYQALGFGQDVQTAFQLARNQIKLMGSPDYDGPSLLVGAGVDPRAIRLISAEENPLRLRPPGSALHQLRAPPSDFVNREEELRDLRVKLGTEGVIVAGITGQRGVGKTALALRLAQELRTHYPDAQIDIDLRGTDSKPLEPSQVMEEVIHAFEPERKLPPDTEVRGRIYRSVLDGKRALLFFDNARGRTQVEPLLPPPGCLLLVTSRQHFILPGIYSRQLETLAEADAASLIRSIVPRVDNTTANELAKACGYLPIALRAVASILAEEPNIDPKTFIERLRMGANSLDELGQALGLDDLYLEQYRDAIRAGLSASTSGGDAYPFDEESYVRVATPYRHGAESSRRKEPEVNEMGRETRKAEAHDFTKTWTTVLLFIGIAALIATGLIRGWQSWITVAIVIIVAVLAALQVFFAYMTLRKLPVVVKISGRAIGAIHVNDRQQQKADVKRLLDLMVSPEAFKDDGTAT